MKLPLNLMIGNSFQSVLGNESYNVLISDSDSKVVVSTTVGADRLKEKVDQCRRIVACVNFCEKIDLVLPDPQDFKDFKLNG